MAHLLSRELGVRDNEGNVNDVIECQHGSISWKAKKGGGHGIPDTLAPRVGLVQAVI